MTNENNELLEAAIAVIERWDSLLSHLTNADIYINRLREAVAKVQDVSQPEDN